MVDASKEVIYIARSESWVNENDFHKIGKCKNFNRLKKRLSTYNTGRLRNLDKFYYESLFVVDKADVIEKHILSELNNYRVDKSEVLDIRHNDLIRRIENIIKCFY